jgi:hypothetical protein
VGRKERKEEKSIDRKIVEKEIVERKIER